MKKMNNKGFSLIELIIVIAIMAVLVAVIAPNLTGYLSKSKKNTDLSNADTMENIITNALQDFTTDSSMAFESAPAANAQVVPATEASTADGYLAKDTNETTGAGTVIKMNDFIDKAANAGDGTAMKNIYNSLKKYVTTNGGKSEINPKVTGNMFQITFHGTYDAGYTCTVESVKKPAADS